jgi:hypothetical protein
MWFVIVATGFESSRYPIYGKPEQICDPGCHKATVILVLINALLEANTTDSERNELPKVYVIVANYLSCFYARSPTSFVDDYMLILGQLLD